MCEQARGWMTFVCWLSSDWDDWVARAVLLVLAAALLSLIIGVLARVLRFFQMDVDDIRRLPRDRRVTRATEEPLTPDEPDADR